MHFEAGSEEETVDVQGEHITTTSRDSSKTPKTWGVSTFDIMANEHGGASTSIRDHYSGRSEGIAFCRLEDALQVLATDTETPQSNFQ